MKRTNNIVRFKIDQIRLPLKIGPYEEHSLRFKYKTHSEKVSKKITTNSFISEFSVITNKKYADGLG